MNGRSPVGTDLTSLFHDLEEVAHRIRTQAEQDLETTESAKGVGEASPGGLMRTAARAARAQVLVEGARGLKKLSDDPGAELNDSDRFGLEAIVLLLARPALKVQFGDFPALESLPPEWTLLDQHRAQIREAIARVGRIEVTGHPDLDWVGTGFLVGADLVMTNRHVANEFARRDGKRWSFVGGRSPEFDLLEEADNPAEMSFTISEVIGIHDSDDIDMALLRVSPTSDNGATSLPTPLKLMATRPDEVVGRPVCVVGYPAWDGRRNEPEPMRRIFMDLYNVKRLQPGVTTQSATPETRLGHDCSTLGGNSGSPVFDLATHQVIGLHFGGRYHIGNVAVPLWRLVDDPMVDVAGVNYVS